MILGKTIILTGLQQAIVHNRPALSLTQAGISGIEPGQLLLLIILEEFVKFRIIGNLLSFGFKSSLAALNPGILGKGFGYIRVVSRVLATGQSQGLQPAGDTGQALSLFVGSGLGTAAVLILIADNPHGQPGIHLILAIRQATAGTNAIQNTRVRILSTQENITIRADNIAYPQVIFWRLNVDIPLGLGVDSISAAPIRICFNISAVSRIADGPRQAGQIDAWCSQNIA